MLPNTLTVLILLMRLLATQLSDLLFSYADGMRTTTTLCIRILSPSLSTAICWRTVRSGGSMSATLVALAAASEVISTVLLACAVALLGS